MPITLAGCLESRKRPTVVKALEPMGALHGKRIRQWKAPEDLRPPGRPNSKSTADLVIWTESGGLFWEYPAEGRRG